MKKLIIDSNELRQALAILQPAVFSKPYLPVLNFIRATIKKDSAFLVAFDGQITITITIPCQAESEFKCLLPFQALKQIVSLEKGVLEISDQGKIIVECGDDVFDLGQADNFSDFPSVHKMPEDALISLDKEVIRSLKDASFTVMKDAKSMANLCFQNYLLEFNKNILSVVSTDGSAVFWRQHEIESDIEASIQIIPQAVSILEGLTAPQIFTGKDRVGFQGGNVSVIFIKPEGKYVSFRSIIPHKINWNASCYRYDLVRAIKKCDIAESEFGKIRMDMGSSKWILSASHEEKGSKVTAPIDGSFSGDSSRTIERVVFDSSRMLGMLGQIHEDVQEIEMSITDKKMIYFRPTGDEKTLLVLAQMME